MTRTPSRALLAALLLAGAACGETGPTATGDSNLSAGESRALAFGVSALGTEQVEELAWSSASLSSGEGALASAGPGGGGRHGGGGIGGLGIWGPHRPGVHGTSNSTVDRTVPCPQGGTLRTVTRVTSVVDTVARTGNVTTEATATPDRCAFAVDSVNAVLRTIANPNTTITITGAPSLVTRTTSSYSWTAASDSTGGRRGRATRGATTGTQTGSFTYTTSDNRSGTCAVNLTTRFDPETRTHTVTGTFCGQNVNLSSTLPERGRGGGRGGHHGGGRG